MVNLKFIPLMIFKLDWLNNDGREFFNSNYMLVLVKPDTESAIE